jgi:hypothetical protein
LVTKKRPWYIGKDAPEWGTAELPAWMFWVVMATVCGVPVAGGLIATATGLNFQAVSFSLIPAALGFLVWLVPRVQIDPVDDEAEVSD